jgi:hypothetical protein
VPDINIPLDQELHRKLQVAAAHQNMSVAEAVRAAIEDWAGNWTELYARLDEYLAARLAAGAAPATADLDRHEVRYFLHWVDTGELPDERQARGEGES